MPANVPLPVDLVHAMPDPALVVDAQGMVTLANEQAVEVLESDPVGRHLSASLRVPAVLDAVNEAAMGEVTRFPLAATPFSAPVSAPPAPKP